MSTINSSSVKGFLELKEVKPCPRDQHTKRAFDGRKLDELHIKNMVMTSNPIITGKSTEKDYRVVGKQTFTYNNTDQSKTFFIICQTVQIIKKED